MTSWRATWQHQPKLKILYILSPRSPTPGSLPYKKWKLQYRKYTYEIIYWSLAHNSKNGNVDSITVFSYKGLLYSHSKEWVRGPLTWLKWLSDLLLILAQVIIWRLWYRAQSRDLLWQQGAYLEILCPPFLCQKEIFFKKNELEPLKLVWRDYSRGCWVRKVIWKKACIKQFLCVKHIHSPK